MTGRRDVDSAKPTSRVVGPVPANDNGEPMSLFAKVFERQAERAPTPHARAVKKRLAERAKELAGEGER